VITNECTFAALEYSVSGYYGPLGIATFVCEMSGLLFCILMQKSKPDVVCFLNNFDHN